MFNISLEMPSGARSRGYDRKTEEKATETFEQVVAFVKPWRDFTADVIMTDIGIESRRERISNA